MMNNQLNNMLNIKLNNMLNIQINIQLNNMLNIQLNNMLNIHLFFFNDTAPNEIYTLSLHDALPISFGFIAAFAAGVIAFLSPCCLPLVPAYVAHLAGVSVDPGTMQAKRGLTMRHAAAFV